MGERVTTFSDFDSALSHVYSQPVPQEWEILAPSDKVCTFCDTMVDGFICSDCGEYKGLMTIDEWEDYTGEVWEP